MKKVEKQAYSVKEFLAAYGITNNKFYDEVNAGRATVPYRHVRGEPDMNQAQVSPSDMYE